MALSEKSLQAIDTITNTGNFYLTFIGVELAILALIGIVVIYVGARRMALKIANQRMNAYIQTDAMAAVRAAISDEVRTQIESRAFVLVQPTAAPDDGDAFPKDPKAKGG